MPRIAGARAPSVVIAASLLLAVAGLLLWRLVLTGPEAQQFSASTPSMRGYSSIDEMAQSADAVVVGTVTAVLGNELHRPSDGNPAPDSIPNDHLATPYVFYSVEVIETLHGETRGGTITVAHRDPSQSRIKEATSMNPGEKLLLFLRDRTGNADGLVDYKDVQDLYVPLSLDAGVFDVDARDVATPRLPRYIGDPSETSKTFNMSEVRQSIQN